MENRDSSRMSMADGPATRRFARFVASPKVRRLAPTRLGFVAVASIALLLLAWSFTTFARSAKQWLHQQSQYEFTYSDIDLRPPPPPWYQGDARVFLSRVSEAASLKPTPFSSLDVSPQEIKRNFGLYCWVDRVERVEKHYPNQVTVKLEYRKPVASPHGSEQFVLDRHGVLLPRKDFEPAGLQPLISILGLQPPFEPHPGERWKTADPSKGIVEFDGWASKAARLAAFLLEASATARKEPNPPPLLQIHVSNDWLLFVRWGEVWVHWGNAPEDEAPGEPEPFAKWARLREWEDQHKPSEVRFPRYLAFTKTGIEVKQGATNSREVIE